MAVEMAVFEAVRRAWLAATRTLADHTDDCLSCLCEWLPGCEDGRRLRAAADAAMREYEGVVCA